MGERRTGAEITWDLVPVRIIVSSRAGCAFVAFRVPKDYSPPLIYASSSFNKVRRARVRTRRFNAQLAFGSPPSFPPFPFHVTLISQRVYVGSFLFMALDRPREFAHSDYRGVMK